MWGIFFRSTLVVLFCKIGKVHLWGTLFLWNVVLKPFWTLCPENMHVCNSKRFTIVSKYKNINAITYIWGAIIFFTIPGPHHVQMWNMGMIGVIPHNVKMAIIVHIVILGLNSSFIQRLVNIIIQHYPGIIHILMM
jgi:hypothetical protein